MKILIKNGIVIDPQNKIEQPLDILTDDGKIKKVAKNIKSANATIIDARDKIVIPGVIDIHTHLREPGHEEEETIASGTLAAAAGGVTSILCMPNTHPVLDNQTTVEFILLKAHNEGAVNVHPVGAIRKGSLGKELGEMGELKKAGVVAISDDGNSVMNALVMRRALEYSGMFNLPVISHCEDINLSKHGVMNEGYVSTLLGLRGIPAESEEIMVARDIMLAKLSGGYLHIAHVSTRGSVELIREAKRTGVKVTAETCPHYFTLTDEKVRDYNTNTKVKPPLRTEPDIKSIIEGLADGTIDCIATDHAPHTEEEKNKEYDLAPFGIIGLETLLPVTITNFVDKKHLPISEVIAKLTANPARIFGIDRGKLSVGAVADIAVVDVKNRHVIKPDFVSKSRNSPYIGWELTGFPTHTIVSGKIVYKR
jgi:dihydroorotase